MHIQYTIQLNPDIPVPCIIKHFFFNLNQINYFSVKYQLILTRLFLLTKYLNER